MTGMLALMIPILAIMVWSPIGKSIAHAIQAGAQGAAETSPAELEQLKARVAELEFRLGEQSVQVQQLQENAEFYKQLIESSEELKRLRGG